MYKFFVWTCVLISLSTYLGIELLGHIVSFNHLRDGFSKAVVCYFTFPPAEAEYEVFFFFSTFLLILIICLLDSSLSRSGVKWCLIVVLIFISWLMMFSIFWCVYWSIAHLPWRNVYFYLLPIFLLGYLSFHYWGVRVYVFWSDIFG